MDGSERFRCEVYRCVLTKASCARRWSIIAGRVRTQSVMVALKRDELAASACKGCQIGEAHAKALAAAPADEAA